MTNIYAKRQTVVKYVLNDLRANSTWFFDILRENKGYFIKHTLVEPIDANSDLTELSDKTLSLYCMLRVVIHLLRKEKVGPNRLCFRNCKLNMNHIEVFNIFITDAEDQVSFIVLNHFAIYIFDLAIMAFIGLIL